MPSTPKTISLSVIRKEIVPEKSAKLLENFLAPSTRARKLTRRFEDFDHERMRAAAEYLNDYASSKNSTKTHVVANPWISDEQQVAGKFFSSAVSFDMGEVETGGVAGVTQVLWECYDMADVETATGSSVYTLMSLPFRRVDSKTILNLYGFEEGENDSVTLVFSAINPTAANRTICEGLSEAALRTALGLGASTRFATYQWMEPQGSESGLAAFMVTFIDPTWTNTTPTHVVVARSGREIACSKQFLATGIPIASVEGKFREVTAQTGFLVQSVSISERGNNQASMSISQQAVFKYDAAGSHSAWSASTVYVSGARVTETGAAAGTYVCLIDHTAAGTFAAEFAAGLWREHRAVPFLVEETTNSGRQTPRTYYSWPRVEPGREDTVYTAALTYKGALGATYFLGAITKRPNADGSWDISSVWYVPKTSVWPGADFADNKWWTYWTIVSQSRFKYPTGADTNQYQHMVRAMLVVKAVFQNDDHSAVETWIINDADWSGAEGGGLNPQSKLAGLGVTTFASLTNTYKEPTISPCGGERQKGTKYGAFMVPYAADGTTESAYTTVGGTYDDLGSGTVT